MIGIRLRALLFSISHLLRMITTRAAFNLLYPKRRLKPIRQHLHDYLNVFAGRLTCAECFLNRYAQLIGRKHLCDRCNALSSKVHSREYSETMALCRSLFPEIRRREVNFLRPQGEARALAVVLINTECDDLAVIGKGALISFMASWRIYVERGFMVLPYLVSSSGHKVDFDQYIARALRDHGADLGFDQIDHLSVISHGWYGRLGLLHHTKRLKLIREGGSVLFNSCQSHGDAQRLSERNPNLRVFASNRMTMFAEPVISECTTSERTTSESATSEALTRPRVDHIIYASDFVLPLIYGRRMQMWSMTPKELKSPSPQPSSPKLISTHQPITGDHMTQDQLITLTRECISTACYDNGFEFTRRDRLDLIERYAQRTLYRQHRAGSLATVFVHEGFQEARAQGAPTILIGSHVDSAYQDHWAELEGDVLRGTVDNGATNAALISLMLDGALPPNVIITFNGDEEDESRGISQAIRYIHRETKLFGPIAFTVILDVTFEKGEGFTIENYFGSSRPCGALRLENESKVMRLIERCFPNARYYHHEVAGADDAWQVDEFDLACLSLCLPSRPHPESWTPNDFACHRGQTIQLSDLQRYRESIVTLSHFLSEVLALALQKIG